MRLALATLAAVSVLAGCAPTGAGRPGSGTETPDRAVRQCFRPDQVINFRQGEAQALNLRILGGEVFEVRSAGCLDLDRSNAVAILPGVGTGRLCVGDSARIIVQDPTISQGPCLARITRALTPAQIEALPSRRRP